MGLVLATGTGMRGIHGRPVDNYERALRGPLIGPSGREQAHAGPSSSRRPTVGSRASSQTGN